jgi:hypothetical protein
LIKGKHRGAHAELRAAAWLLEQGYEVFRNVSGHGKIDLVAVKDGEVRFFDVKASYKGGCPNSGIEHLSPLLDGGFKAMGERKKQTPTRPETPREKVLRKLEEGALT